MSVWAVQLDAGSYIEFANNASLGAATKVWGAFSVNGDYLNHLPNGSGTIAIDVIGNADHSTPKCGLTYVVTSAVFGALMSDGGDYILTVHTGLNLGQFDPALYYDVLWVAKDTATMGCDFIVQMYNAGDLGGTAVASWKTFGTLPVLNTTSTVGCRRLNVGQTGFTSMAGTYDWAKIGQDNTFGFENAPLEEGSGTAVTPSGTITGSFQWVNPAAGPDHGVVTITPPSVLNGEGAVAVAQWFDASNNLLSPQPSTGWQVNGDSHAATIDASGNITSVAAGTATIRAAAGATTATADVTVRPTIVFAETVSVA